MLALRLHLLAAVCNFSGGMEGDKKFLFGATVATGFERTALDECTEKLGHEINAAVDRGRVFFEIHRNQLRKDEALQELCRHLSHSDWVHAVDAWTLVRGVDFIPSLLEHTVPSPTPTERLLDNLSIADTETNRSQKPSGEDFVTGNSPSKETPPRSNLETSHHQPVTDTRPRNYLPTFRVTGHRVSDSHLFSSREAAGKLGEYLIQRYGWPVKMKEFEMEVLVNVNNNDATIGINLTAESMHKRNIVHFGPTTLRSTLAHCMLRLGEPQPGDVICDPMCGGGSIPIEAVQNWPCFVLGGDNHDIACQHAGGNVTAVNEKRRSNGRPDVSIDVVQWDVTSLPLRSDSIDLLVSDMPFGKRMGSRLNNWELYRRGLVEMGRVCRQGTGKAVLLTQDKKCMAKILQKVSSVWKRQLQLTINIGGLFACVYVLKRRGQAKPTVAQGTHDGNGQEGME
ncbi:THUMP domain-containing protein 3-like isoform X2 [Patiria miniata]|uniref:THUMP domain-containing protein n=1 Tax=Patiria miniata TaxID=46514 RepID=A0A914AXP5_PATMI|nr:THUMP domain-containing protein 3-like isoform X2 [Patiria miniata]